MRNIEIVQGEYYHVFNRAVDGQTIFKDRRDFERFLLLLHYGNRLEPIPVNFSRKCWTLRVKQVTSDVESLVKIGSYVVMPNHFHLKLLQIAENGIQKFLHRIQMGYAKYFNTRYERKGRLFQSVYQCVHIQSEAQWEHLDNYIHLNPLDLYMPSWRDGVSTFWGDAKMFLESYPWSSYQLFAGYKEPVSIIDPAEKNQRSLEVGMYQKELENWISRNTLDRDIPGALLDT